MRSAAARLVPNLQRQARRRFGSAEMVGDGLTGWHRAYRTKPKANPIPLSANGVKNAIMTVGKAYRQVGQFSRRIITFRNIGLIKHSQLPSQLKAVAKLACLALVRRGKISPLEKGWNKTQLEVVPKQDVHFLRKMSDSHDHPSTGPPGTGERSDEHTSCDYHDDA